MTPKKSRASLGRMYLARHLPQALPAQAIAACGRHRQARGFLGAPARR
jgi:hypothetical protein